MELILYQRPYKKVKEKMYNNDTKINSDKIEKNKNFKTIKMPGEVYWVYATTKILMKPQRPRENAHMRKVINI